MAERAADVEKPDAHSAIVSSAFGRAVVALALVVLGAWITLPNLPAGPMRSQLEPLWRPATEAGLVQDWAVFSPNPRAQSLDVRAEIQLASGRVVVWDVPEFDPIVGAFRQYRWKKWQERVRLDVRRDLWAPTIEWLRREYADDEPVRVTLIRRWIDHGPLTDIGRADDPRVGWNEFRFCTWPAGSDGETPGCGA
ncbi:MAG: hypothetical protein AAFP84_14155 [Actinomycetota bacterium]